jgi:GAF domain-containing protein
LEKTNRLLRAREEELEAMQLVQEERMNTRTRQITTMNQLILERAGQLDSIVEITRSVLAIQELDRLLSLIVQSLSEKFGYYHVGLYLLDEQKQNAVLMASSSEVGLRIMEHGQHQKISDQNLIGYTIRSSQPRTITDTSTDSRFQPQPELSNTRSELALPLKVNQIAFGVLDFHSDTAKIFSEEYISMLSILGDMIAVTVQNSILHEKAQRTLSEAEVSSRNKSVNDWDGWVESVQSRGYRYDGIRVEALKKPDSSGASQKRLETIPIRLRGQTIGSIKIQLSEASPDWTEDDRAIAEATAERAALALEGARLLDEAKRRAAREAFLSDVAAKLGASFQLDSILRDTVEELGQTLEDSTVSFHLIDPSLSNSIKNRTPDDPMGSRQDSD